MNTPDTTGGPAFPIHLCTLPPGMTLLDYFAGEALKGYISHHGRATHEADRARACYDMAAAMIVEKRRRETQDAS